MSDKLGFLSGLGGKPVRRAVKEDWEWPGARRG